LKLKRLRILFLPARTFKINDEFARDRQGDSGSEIFLDQRQGQIDPRGYARGGVKLSVFQKNGVWLKPELWKTPGRVGRESPVRSHPAAIVADEPQVGSPPAPSEQPLCAKAVNPGANRHDSPRLACPRFEPHGDG